MNNSANGAVAQPAPLYASSWIALFAIIRHRLAERSEKNQASESSAER